MAIDTVVTFDDLLRQQGKTPASNTSKNSFKASDYYNSGWYSPSSQNSYTGGLGYRDVQNYNDYFHDINQKYNTPSTNYFDSSAGIKQTGSSTPMGLYDTFSNGDFLQTDKYISALNNKYGGYEDVDTTSPNVNNAWGPVGGNSNTNNYNNSYNSSSNSGYNSGYGGQMGGIQDYLDSMMAQYQQAYEAQLSAMREAQAAQERARREALGYAQGGVNQSSDDALRQAYIQSRKAQRDMPQQLAAQGISGGLSESTAASLQNQYGENRNELEQARQQALAQLASEYATGAAADASGYNMQIANILGQQAQQNAALQQWGYEQMLNEQNAARAASASRKYYEDPEFQTTLQQVATGQVSGNALRNLAGGIVGQWGLEGYNFLIKQANDLENSGGFSFSNGVNNTSGNSAGGIPDPIMAAILAGNALIPSYKTGVGINLI